MSHNAFPAFPVRSSLNFPQTKPVIPTAVSERAQSPALRAGPPTRAVFAWWGGSRPEEPCAGSGSKSRPIHAPAFQRRFVYFPVNFPAPPPPICYFCCKQRAKCNSTRQSQDCRRPFFVSFRPRIAFNFFGDLNCQFYSFVTSQNAPATCQLLLPVADFQRPVFPSAWAAGFLARPCSA